MEYFCKCINIGRLAAFKPVPGRTGTILQKIPTKEFYYLKRVCVDREARHWWEAERH